MAAHRKGTLRFAVFLIILVVSAGLAGYKGVSLLTSVRNIVRASDMPLTYDALAPELQAAYERRDFVQAANYLVSYLSVAKADISADGTTSDLLGQFATLYAQRLTDAERSNIEAAWLSRLPDNPIGHWIRAQFLSSLGLCDFALQDLQQALQKDSPPFLSDPILQGRVEMALQSSFPDPGLVAGLLDDLLARSTSPETARAALYRIAVRGPAATIEYCRPENCQQIGGNHYHLRFIDDVLPLCSDDIRRAVADDAFLHLLRPVPDLIRALHTLVEPEAIAERTDLAREVGSLIRETAGVIQGACSPSMARAGLALLIDLCHELLMVDPEGLAVSPKECLEDIQGITQACRANKPGLLEAYVGTAEAQLLLMQGRFAEAGSRSGDAVSAFESVGPVFTLEATALESERAEAELVSFFSRWYAGELGPAAAALEDLAGMHSTGPEAWRVHDAAVAFGRHLTATGSTNSGAGSEAVRKAEAIAGQYVDVPWLGDASSASPADPVSAGLPSGCCGGFPGGLKGLQNALLALAPEGIPREPAKEAKELERELKRAIQGAARNEGDPGHVAETMLRLVNVQPQDSPGQDTAHALQLLLDDLLAPDEKLRLAQDESLGPPANFKAFAWRNALLVAVAEDFRRARDEDEATQFLRKAAERYQHLIANDFAWFPEGQAQPAFRDYNAALAAIRSYLLIRNALGEEPEAYDEVVAQLSLNEAVPERILDPDMARFLYWHYLDSARTLLTQGDPRSARKLLALCEETGIRIRRADTTPEVANEALSSAAFAARLRNVTEWMQE